MDKLVVKGKIYLENKNIFLGKNVIFYPGVSFCGNGKICIGNNCKIGQNTILYASNDGGIIIGDNTIIAANTYIIDTNHKIERDRLISEQGFDTQKITIGTDVWIGANCTLAKGTVIGDAAVVGAQSFVNKTLNPYTINVGVPTREIGERK